jgi:hypothetical protein
MSIESTLTPQVVDAERVEKLSPDETIGMLHQDSEEFPKANLFDLNRVQAAIAEYRNEFRERDANIGLVVPVEGDNPHLAIWPDTDPLRAVVVCPRLRPEGGEFE